MQWTTFPVVAFSKNREVFQSAQDTCADASDDQTAKKMA